jgi:hypothetical protein
VVCSEKPSQRARRLFVYVTLAIIAMAFVVASITMLIIPPIKTQVFSVKSIPLKNWVLAAAFMIIAGLLLVTAAVS